MQSQQKEVTWPCCHPGPLSYLAYHLPLLSYWKANISALLLRIGVECQPALRGGPQSAVALWSLKLGLAFYDSAMAATLAIPREADTPPDAGKGLIALAHFKGKY